MIPDFVEISEMSLFSYGFNQSKLLSRKLSQLHKLCSELLSYQHHYEFGIRSIKCILSMADSMRRYQIQLSEEQIVLKCILDLHTPKLHGKDLPLFESIYRELFPGVEILDSGNEDIVRWIQTRLEQKKLQATPWFINKIHQLYQMICAKHGVIMVGETMSCKTTAWQVLADVLKDLKNDESTRIKEYEVTCRIINPKAVAIGDLFGKFDYVSLEWVDGVLAKTFREMASASTENRGWIVFDGPIDPIWVEKLNTLLDDNKKLCLTSGEMIEKSNLMTMVFETVNLEQASPATVSRCGIVYMDHTLLGWEVLHKSFVGDLEALGLNEIYMSLYETLVDWLVPAVIEMLEGFSSVIEITTTLQYKVSIINTCQLKHCPHLSI